MTYPDRTYNDDRCEHCGGTLPWGCECEECDSCGEIVPECVCDDAEEE